MKRKIVLFGVITMLVSITLTSCQESVKGNGNITEQGYDVKDFSSLTITGMFQVELIKGKPRYELIIDDNLHDYVTHKQEGNELTIGSQDVFLDADTAVLKVYFNRLTELEIQGAGQVYSNHTFLDPLEVEVNGASEMDLSLAAPSFDLEINGGGGIKLEGAVAQLSIEINGAAEVDAFELKSDMTSIELSGAGEVRTWTERDLNVELQGAGNVEYIGQPKVTKDIVGVGQVEQKRPD